MRINKEIALYYIIGPLGVLLLLGVAVKFFLDDANTRQTARRNLAILDKLEAAWQRHEAVLPYIATKAVDGLQAAWKSHQSLLPDGSRQEFGVRCGDIFDEQPYRDLVSDLRKIDRTDASVEVNAIYGSYSTYAAGALDRHCRYIEYLREIWSGAAAASPDYVQNRLFKLFADLKETINHPWPISRPTEKEFTGLREKYLRDSQKYWPLSR